MPDPSLTMPPPGALLPSPSLAIRGAFALAMATVVGASNWLVQYPINDLLTWGAFSYPIAFLVTDVCNRCFGARRAREVAFVGFAVGIAFCFWINTLNPPPPDAPSISQIAFASGTAFLVSQLLDVAVFNRLRRASWWKAPFWGSVAASILDTAIFFSIAFHGTDFPWVPLALGDLGVKLLMAVLLLAPYRALVRRLLSERLAA